MFRLFDANGWMWSEAVAALERAERRQRQLLGAAERGRQRPAWEPQADVYETAIGFHVTVALPGIRHEQVSLVIDEEGLMVRTQRTPVSPPGVLRVQRMEIPYGVFERRIALPPGRYVLMEQRLADGFLDLLLARE